jgi:hemolysin III
MNFLKISKEEKANIITHGLGFVAALIGIPFLFSATTDDSSGYQLALIIFAVSMLFVYASSTIYHLMIDEKRKFLWKKIDHIAIYFLIAGTNTPLVIQYLENPLARNYLILLWSMVTIGIIYKLFLIGKYQYFSLIFYIILGGLGIGVIAPMLETMPIESFYWLLSGGIAYLGGTVFYMWKSLPFSHAIWHVFVIIGTFCHYMAILNVKY